MSDDPVVLPNAVEVDHRDGCAHVPIRFDHRFLESFDVSVGKAARTAAEAIRQLVAGEIHSLLLSGPVGAGKSLLAAIACNELAWPFLEAEYEADRKLEAAIAAGDVYTPPLRERVQYRTRVRERRCPRWLPVTSALGELRREMHRNERPNTDRYADLVGAHGLLVLDDLGAERATDWTLSTLFEPVAERYDSDMPVIVTSNLSASELANAGYSRIVSRLADEGALVEMSSAKDYRLSKRRTVIA